MTLFEVPVDALRPYGSPQGDVTAGWDEAVEADETAPFVEFKKFDESRVVRDRRGRFADKVDVDPFDTLKDLGVDVSGLDGVVSSKRRRRLAQTVVDVMEDYPVLKGALKEVSLGDLQAQSALGLTEPILPYGDFERPEGWRVVLDREFMNWPTKRFWDEMTTPMATYFHASVERQPEMVLIHELGHAVHMESQHVLDFPTVEKFQKAARRWPEIDYSTLVEAVDVEPPSLYANANPAEFAAELFLATRNFRDEYSAPQLKAWDDYLDAIEGHRPHAVSTKAFTSWHDARIVCDFGFFDVEAKDLVRTAAGARRYGQPVGSVIVRDPVKVDVAAWDQVRAHARDKLAALPPPDPAAIEKHTALAERIARGEVRAGGELRGNSTDRRRSRENLFKEFGGLQRGFVPCVYCGLPLSANGEGHPQLTRDKLRVFRDGGGYQLFNLVPACAACNAHRNDAPPDL